MQSTKGERANERDGLQRPWQATLLADYRRQGGHGCPGPPVITNGAAYERKLVNQASKIMAPWAGRGATLGECGRFGPLPDIAIATGRASIPIRALAGRLDLRVLQDPKSGPAQPVSSEFGA
jgi:hypothetical protein